MLRYLWCSVQNTWRCSLALITSDNDKVCLQKVRWLFSGHSVIAHLRWTVAPWYNWNVLDIYIAFSERNDIKYIYKQTNKREKIFMADISILTLKLGPAWRACKLLMLAVAYINSIYTTVYSFWNVYDHVFSFVFNWLSFQNLLGLLYSLKE